MSSYRKMKINHKQKKEKNAYERYTHLGTSVLNCL